MMALIKLSKIKETFNIFIKGLNNFALIAICVFAPLTIISILGPSQASLQASFNEAQADQGMLAYLFNGYDLYTLLISLLTIFSITIGFSALSVATGQYINDNKIDIENCFRQISWRFLSILFITGILLTSIITTMLGFVLFIPTIGLLSALGIGAFFLTLISLLVTVHEGEKYFSAIKRGFRLAEYALLKVAGTMILISIIGFFVKFVLDLPKLLLISSINNEIILFKVLFETVGLISISVSVTFVAIAVTLLYLDMRDRFDSFNAGKLSHQTGL